MTRLGMLTPSSNTALEPITYAMLAGIEDAARRLRHLAQFAAAPTYPMSARVGSADCLARPEPGFRPPIPSMSDASR